jgi:hypothetical protein
MNTNDSFNAIELRRQIGYVSVMGTYKMIEIRQEKICHDLALVLGSNEVVAQQL